MGFLYTITFHLTPMFYYTSMDALFPPRARRVVQAFYVIVFTLSYQFIARNRMGRFVNGGTYLTVLSNDGLVLDFYAPPTLARYALLLPPTLALCCCCCTTTIYTRGICAC